MKKRIFLGEKVSTVMGNDPNFYFNINNDKNLIIGRNFRGEIDNIRIYKEVLNEAEIRKIYAQNLW